MTTATRTRRPAPTFDHLLKRKPRTKTLYFSDSEDLNAEFTAAQAAWSMAMIDTEAKVEQKKTKAELDKVIEKLKADPETRVVKLQGIGNGKYERLQRQFPPSKEQIEEWESQSAKYETPKPQFDEDEFYPALLSVCAVEPAMTVEQAKELSEEWSGGDMAQLVGTAIALCQGSSAVDLNLGN
jgi:hypothetical protein